MAAAVLIGNAVIRVQSLQALTTDDTRTLCQLHQELRKRGALCITWFIAKAPR